MVRVIASAHDRTGVPNCWYAGPYRQADGTTPAESAIVQKDLFRSTFNSVAVRVLLNALWVSVLSANAANWYVRPGGTGSRNGTDWNNAWDCGSIGWSSVSGGDTIWLAGGSYTSSIVPGKSGSAGNYIYVKRVRATDAIPTSAAGWSAGFDTQVVIQPSTAACISYTAASGVGSYMYWDGRIDSGIRLLFQDTQSYNAAVSIPPSAAGGQTQVVFTNIDMSGPYNGQFREPAYQIGPVRLSGKGQVSYFTFANCRMRDAVNMLGVLYNCSQITFDHCKMYDGTSTGVNGHANWAIVEYASDLTFKYCEFWNWSVEGLGLGAGVGTIYFYGNVVRDGASMVNGAPMSPRVFEVGGFWGSSYSVYGVGPIYCYNNTFVNISYAVWTSVNGGYWHASSVARNNIIWNANWNGGAGPDDSDYNYADESLGEANSVNGSGASPFADYANRDLRIVSAVSSSLPRNKGASIGALSGQTYSIDPNGNLRGSDGAWDIGAYEYGSISTNPVISVTPMSLTFGAVPETKVVTNFITVQNVGGGKLAGTATLGSTSSDFSIVSGQTYSLDANQSAQVGIRYAPTKAADSVTVIFSGGGQATASVSGQMQVAMSELSFPASSGVVTAPFTKDISGYVSQSVQTGLAGGGRAVYAFRITNPGKYTISATVNAPDMSANSFYVNIDAEPTDPTMIWDVPVTAGFVNQTVSWRGNGTDTANQYVPVVFNLSADVHQLVIVGREAGVQLGSIIIAPDNGANLSPPPPPEKLRFVSVGF